MVSRPSFLHFDQILCELFDTISYAMLLDRHPLAVHYLYTYTASAD